METLLATFWDLLIPTVGVILTFWLYNFLKKNKVAKIKKIAPINTTPKRKWSMQQLVGDFSELLPEVHINPPTVWIIRIFLSGVMASLSFVILLFITKGITNDFLDYSIYFATAFVFYLFYKKEEVVIHAPKQHVVVVTFAGTEVPIYLIDGDFPWYGTAFLFGISNHPGMPASNNKHNFITTAEQLPGRINTGVRTLPIWASETNRVPQISEFSRDKVQIIGSYTVSIRTTQPKKWLKFNNAIRQICDIARSAIIELNSLFIATDFNDLISESQELLKGNMVILAFATKGHGEINLYSVARGYNGKPISLVINKNDIEEAILDPESPTTTEAEYLIGKIREFEEKMRKNLNTETLKEAFTTDSKIQISVMELTNSIAKIAGETGSEITSIAVSGIKLPQRITDAIEQVKIEGFERISEEATRQSIVTNAEKMPTDDRDLALVLASINSKLPGVKVNFTTGKGSQFEKAASIIANSKEE